MSAHHAHRQSGFTLLEMLAAVTLLTIGFFIVLTAMGSATRSLIKDDQSTQLALMARSLWDEHAHDYLKAGVQQGTEAGAQWQLTTTLLRRSSSVQMFKLVLAIDSNGRHEEFSALHAQGTLAGLSP